MELRIPSLEQLKTVYNSDMKDAFPAAELKPLRAIETMWREGRYRPYCLYRQKNTLQNLENIGWCKPGYEGYYNIYIMEEVHSILSAGAGGSTKLRQPGCGEHIERIFNYKYANEYINGFDVILERKRGLGEFYGRYLDSQTSG